MASSKKKILFVNESLACAGGEKSLLSILSSLDYDKYDVDLQLFKYGNPWDKLVDPHVKILPPLPYAQFTGMPLLKAILYALRHRKLSWLKSRLAYSAALRKNKEAGNVTKSILYWKKQSKCFDNIAGKYDYVIGYAQGIPTFYVADKADPLSKKLAWVNATYLPPSPDKEYIEQKFSKINIINFVTEELAGIERKHWPSIENKSTAFPDLINPELITKMSKEEIDIKKDNSKTTIVTLGRLTLQKGYDMCIEAAKVLKDNNLNFIWYILGEGPYRVEMEQAIQNFGLNDNVKLLGVKTNPYPYLRLADIYVQASRREGFGLAIAEARLLNIPVVATRFNTVFNQMINRKNGIVVDMTGPSIAAAIMELCEDKDLYNSILAYLQTESKGNIEMVPQFYEILSSIS